MILLNSDQGSTRSTSPEVGPGESQGCGDTQRGAAHTDPQLSQGTATPKLPQNGSKWCTDCHVTKRWAQVGTGMLRNTCPSLPICLLASMAEVFSVCVTKQSLSPIQLSIDLSKHLSYLSYLSYPILSYPILSCLSTVSIHLSTVSVYLLYPSIYCIHLSYPSYPILSYPVLSCPVLSYAILSYPILSILSYPILSYPSYPILSYPILSYPILSYPILSYPILSYPSYPILSYPILSYPILSYLSYPIYPILSILSYPILSCPVLSCPVLSCPVLSCPVLSCPVLSCPVLSCPVLSCPVLSCPVLSCPVLSCPVLSCPPAAKPFKTQRRLSLLSSHLFVFNSPELRSLMNLSLSKYDGRIVWDGPERICLIIYHSGMCCQTSELSAHVSGAADQ